MEKTRCRCGQSARTLERTNSLQSNERLAEHDGQNPLRLQENDNKNSFLQFGHRMRAKPFFRMPQSRYFSTTREMTARHLPQCFSKRNRIRSFFGVSLPINFFLFLSARLPHKRQAASRNAPSVKKGHLPTIKDSPYRFQSIEPSRVIFIPAKKTQSFDHFTAVNSA